MYEVVKNYVWPTPFFPAYCRPIYHAPYDIYNFLSLYIYVRDVNRVKKLIVINRMIGMS